VSKAWKEESWWVMRKKIDLTIVPEPYRTLAFTMHTHGKVQEHNAIWEAVYIAHGCNCGYSPEIKAQNIGWLRGLDFRIMEILYDLKNMALKSGRLN